MKRRTIDIINDLSKSETITVNQLAGKYDVSVRTIRNDIKVINDFLSNYGFDNLYINRNGLIKVNRSFLSSRKYLHIDNLYDYKLSQSERTIMASCILLMTNDYITISQIADELYVSRTTIINDLPRIQEYLKTLDISLHTHQNKGILAIGNEFDIRIALIKILLLNDDSNDLFIAYVLKHIIFTHDEYSNIVNNINTNIVNNIINEVETEYQIKFTKDSFQTLSFYLNLLVERNNRGMHITDHTVAFGDEYHCAQDIFRYLCQYCKISSDESEIKALGYFIKNYLHYDILISTDRETIAIQVLTRKLIEKVSRDLKLDLTRDYQLYENLSNHLNSIYRHSIEEDKDNPVLQDIKNNQKTVISAVNNNIDIVINFFHRPLTETDIIYIVIHFCAAIERYKTIKTDYDVILICNNGIGTSQLIQAKLVKSFQIDIVKIIPSYEINNLTPKSADLLISVVPIYDAPIDFINISPRLTEDDFIIIGNKLTELRLHNHIPVGFHNNQISETGIMNSIRPILINDSPANADILYDHIQKAIHKYLNQMEPARQIVDTNSADAISPFLHHLLTPEFITLDVECKDWREAIRKSAQQLLNNGYIEQRYIASMIHGVEEFGPYIEIAKSLAIPHAGLNDGSYRVGMSMIRLSTPINFGIKELDPVRYVVTLSSVDAKIHLRALFHLLSLWQNETFLNELDMAVTAKEANRIIEKYEYTLSDY